MTQFTEGMDKKSFLMLIAYISESATDEIIIKYHEDIINRYQKAKENNESKERLISIFNELTILSYINITRLIGKDAIEIMKEIDKIDRVFNLIHPKQN